MIWRDGFLGYHTSFMLDFVVVALVIVVPLILWSLWEVKFRRNYETHRWLQIVLAGVLLLAVSLFEIDLQWIQGGWRNIVARQSPPLTAAEMWRTTILLRTHLVFAISTPFVWAIALFGALRHFSKPAKPSSYSRRHALLGWIATVDLVLTSVTGLLFYFLTFVR